MPAAIVLVHDDSAFGEATADALRAAGNTVATFTGSLRAMSALEQEQQIDLLITGVNFPDGQPHGVALARMVLVRRRKVKVLFVAQPAMLEHTENLGVLLPAPATPADVVAAANRLLAQIDDDRPN
jgi:DNA-binding NtrC family response regulator